MSWAKPAESASWQEDFGQRLRAARLAVGLSQMQLANAADIDVTYLSDVEQGRRNIGLVNIRVLALTIGISARDLFPPPGD